MAEYDADNIFAKILRGELPCHEVWQDDVAFAFMDLMPESPGHVLVLPKAPSRNLLDADAETLSALILRVQRIARAVKEAFDSDGVTIRQFNEPAGGQTVFHLHFHVLPRWEDLPLKPHGGEPEKPEVLAEQAAKIRRAIV
jgi:histidine triad (HIT) family protein